MIEQREDGWLIVVKVGRTIPIVQLTTQDSVTALITLGYDADTAQVFGHGAERGRVVELGKRRKVLS